MKTNSFRFCIVGIVAALLLIPGRMGSCSDPVRLRVLSYNIHHGEGIDRKLDLPRIAKVILSVNPDVVALQEVDQKAKRTGEVDQPTEIAELTNMQVAFGANIELQGGHYGNAILSKFPIADFRNHLLPNLNDGEQRGVLAAKIRVPGVNHELTVLGTHFDHRRDDRERVLSAKKVNSLFADGPRAAILMGDFNDTIGSQTLALMEENWKRTNVDAMPTVPVTKPRKQIDFVFVRPAGKWSVVETRVLDEAVASDHRPIFSVLELKTQPALSKD